MEGFAIWGAITGSIGAINIVKSWIQELRGFLKEAKDAANTLQKFSVKFEICQANLEGWRDLYGLEESSSVTYQEELWGPRNKKTFAAIRGSLELIHSSIEDIKSSIATFLREADMLMLPEGLQDHNSTMAGIQLAARSRLKIQETKRQLTRKKTIQFVMTSGPDLLKGLEQIKDLTTELKATAKDAFSRKHNLVISGDHLPAETIDKVKKSVLYKLAYDTRLGSKGLYQSCHAASKKALPGTPSIHDIKLEMDLRRRGVPDNTTATTTDSIALEYQFLVTWPNKLLEISVEGPRRPEIDPSKYNASDASFYEACMKALRTGESGNFQVQSVAEATWFSSRVPAGGRRIMNEELWSRTDQLKPLATLLYDLNTDLAAEPVERFPRSERIKLAFKIVECGLFLAGTSWLAGLKSQLIQRSRRGLGDGRHFLLDTSASKAEFRESDFGDFAAHAFAIGTLLTELGTGRLVHGISERHTLQAQGFSLYAAKTNPPSNPTLYSGARINELLVIAMGDDYARAVKVCLESKESWKAARSHRAVDRAEIYRKILADYYLEVFLPLEALQKKIEWDM